jgi:hypothetical protein
MSYLPEPETDIRALIDVGYTVTYTNSKDSFTTTLDLHDCIKETVTKNGIVCSPEGDKPSTKWFDKASRQLVAAAWHNEQGQYDRANAPAFVCERTSETGSFGNDKGYRILGYLRNGAFHNTAGAAHINDEFYKGGRTVRTLEDHYLGGTLMSYIRRDRETGKIIPEVSSPRYSRSGRKTNLHP